MRRFAYLALGIILFAGCSKKQQGLPDADNSYAVETVNSSSADLNTTYPATIRGIQDVEIRPKIAGNITQIYVAEGQAVHRGQILFTIDSEQYVAAVRAAEAQIKVCQANIATQRLTVANQRLLHSKQIISDYAMKSAENQLQALQAQLASAQAQLSSARDNLKWCTVSSPADGVIGLLPYKVGTLVGPSMAEAFTTVSNIERVHIYFSMTEKQLLAMARTSNGGVKAAIKNMPNVRLKLADGTIYDEYGTIDAVSGVINQSTGAVQMRATFSNSRHLLHSGGTGNILLPTIVSNTIKVPQAAVTEIQDKKFVYIVGAKNKVKSTEITVEEQNDGTYYYVTSGLKAGDRIVIEGVQNLKDDMEIKPITPQQAAEKRAQAAKDVKEGKLPF
ncbi:efflux RND transporter periplasmic adaptor subunit [uncultured Alloprevotella sp.]|uniref:efflux RND transporter periplasmic adaptor subunit n=1 Tax=uncultured Alloprevotella sp. TaxID=1283315 RepID=UPI00325FCFC1